MATTSETFVLPGARRGPNGGTRVAVSYFDAAGVPIDRESAVRVTWSEQAQNGTVLATGLLTFQTAIPELVPGCKAGAWDSLLSWVI